MRFVLQSFCSLVANCESRRQHGLPVDNGGGSRVELVLRLRVAIHRLKVFFPSGSNPGQSASTMNNYAKGWASPEKRRTYNCRNKRNYDGETSTTVPRGDSEIALIQEKGGGEPTYRPRKLQRPLKGSKRETETLLDLTVLPSYQIIHTAKE